MYACMYGWIGGGLCRCISLSASLVWIGIYRSISLSVLVDRCIGVWVHWCTGWSVDHFIGLSVYRTSKYA